MLKRNITYDTYTDPPETLTEPFYFNLTKSELVVLDASYEGGMAAAFARIGEQAKIREEGVNEFRSFILAAYGVRSDDGKRFIKTEELRKEFEQHAAYDVLFIELSTNDKKMADFIIGVMPSEFTSNLKEGLNKDEIMKNIQIPPLAPPAIATEG